VNWNELAISAGRVLIFGLALSIVLVLTGEFRWGSGAMIGFAGLWTFGLLREVVRYRKVTSAVQRETPAHS
jgi:hypothetical protein